MKKYTVNSGDTLGVIAKRFYNDASKYKVIAEANHITDPNNIHVGQELLIPDGSEQNTNNNSDEKTNKNNYSFLEKGDIYRVESLKLIMPSATSENINKFLAPLNSKVELFKINTPLRAVHFIAQLAHESASFKYTAENLNYSAKALRAVFGRYFPTDEMAEAYARQPEEIANRVYANRMSNGDEESGDGWKYRGRGLIQLTGKDNYSRCGRALQLDLINHPELLDKDPQAAVAAAAWFWDMAKLNTYADKDDLKAVTRRINGGYNGLHDREEYLNRAKDVMLTK